MQALEGLRVLDLTRALAGPYCTMMLGDLGADVIKVERPITGDESRGWGPPFVGEPYGPYAGESAYYLSANRNKRSITVNLKSLKGRQVVRELAGVSDVLVENFRAGMLSDAGLGYEDLHADHPGLIYCSITGYGQTGPFAERPGYDFVIQAEGGLMGITGPEDGPPYRVGVPIVDITTGMFAATAILAALHCRGSTGQGQLLDVPLFDSQVALLTNVAANFLIGEEEHRRLGNSHPNITPYEAFEARDRWFALAAANERQWAILCDVIGMPELRADPRFTDNRARVSNRKALRELLCQAFASQDAAHWLEKLQAAGLPCAPINSVPDVFAHPQVVARDLILETSHPSAGTVRLPGFPYKLSATPASVRLPPPRLGEHTQEVLGELLGCPAATCRALSEQGCV